MDLVPNLLDSFDFADVFKQNEELAEAFFTHIISGDYSGWIYSIRPAVDVIRNMTKIFNKMRPYLRM
jgi:DNA-binding phage protein